MSQKHDVEKARYWQAVIRDAARSTGAKAVFTTEKDRVRLGKLGESLPLQTARLRIEIENEAEAFDGLVKELSF